MSEDFRLPDLGEGLPEAEIVQWHVAEGDTVSLNQTLASEKEAVGKEATFNNLLIVIVGLLMGIIAVLSYFYIRLKNQKQSTRRRRSSRSRA